MNKIVDYDAWQKLQLAPLTNFNPQILQSLKYSQHSGYLLELERLYSTMYLEWPTLKKDASDMTEAVAGLTWTVAPFCQDGGEPDELAKEVAKVVSDALWRVSPQKPGEFSHCFTELLGSMVHALYRSVNVHEVVWKFTPELVFPLEYKQLGPQYYMWETRQGEPDRLMLVPDGMDYARPVPFEPGRFVVALNTTGPDHPMYNADFYSLVGYFVAAKFGLPGLQSFVKRYGHPLRKFTVEDRRRREDLEAKLKATPDVYDVFLGPGEELDVTAIPAGANVPHEVLLRVAENACHQLIKGNTLTSDVGDKGGSRAQAEVHMGVEASLVRKRGEFVARVLNRQLIPYIVLRNYGRMDLPMPELRCQVPEQKANIQKAQYWQAVLGIPGMRVLKSAVHDDLGLAVPGEGDEVYEGASSPAAATPTQGAPDMPEGELEVGMASRTPQAAGGTFRERVEAMLPVAMRKWAGPTIERFEAMLRAGRSPKEILARLEELRPDTQQLVAALRAATDAAVMGAGSEDAAAANPYGCNQYGEGWASPHNGSSTSYQITGFQGQRRKMLTQQDGGNKVTVRTDKKHPGKDAYPSADDASLNRQAAEERKKAEEKKRKAEEEKRKKEEEERRKKEEEEKKRKEEEERKKAEEEKKKKEAEEEKKRKEEEAKKKAEEAKKKKEEAAKRKAEADKKRAEREAEKKAKAERKEKEAAVKTAEKVVKDTAKELKGRITRYSGSRTVSDVTAAMNAVIRKAEAAKRELLGDAYFDVKPEDVIPAKLLKQIEATPSRLNATGQAEAEAEIARREPIMKINLELLLGGEVDDGFGGKKKITGILENDMERVLTFCEVSKYAGHYFRGRMLSEARLEGTNSNDLDGRNHPVCSLLARSLGGAIHHYNTGSYGDTFVRFKPEVRERTTFTGINSLDCDRIGGVKTSSLLTAPAKGQAFTYGQIAAMNRGEKLNDLVKKNYMEAQIRGLLTARHIESIGVPKKRVDGWAGPKTHDSEAETKAGKLAAQLAKVTGRETLVEDGGNHFLVRFK